jgi:hypothetical protein
MDGNFVGIVQFDSWSGNEVWLFHVASTPFIMWSIPNGNYELVGEAYINGRMEEEGLLVMMCLLRMPFLSLSSDQSSLHTVLVLSNQSQYNSP